MIILKYLTNILLGLSTYIGFHVSYLLLSSTSKGIDITDEGHYILSAQYPELIFSNITHVGYYTGLLFILSGENISYFRIVGIILLLIISTWFVVELCKYIEKKFLLTLSFFEKSVFGLPIILSSLAYYKFWLLTPSYNWLAFIATLLTFIAFMRIINNKDINYPKYIFFDYILLSFSFNLSFMAKPTTALVLVCLAFLFLLHEYKYINLKKSIVAVFTLSAFIITLQILVLDGGFTPYFLRLVESMDRLALMGGNHTLNSRFFEMISLIQIYFFEKFYFTKISSFYIYIFLLALGFIFVVKDKMNVAYLYTLLILGVIISYTYYMFTDITILNYKLLWIRFVEVLLLLFILFLPIFLHKTSHHNIFIFFKKIIIFILIFGLGSFAYKFGTNNGIISAMSDSVLFIVVPIMVLSLLIDKQINIIVFTPILGFIISLVIYNSNLYGYKHPYRLTSSIEKQNNKINLLGELWVDTQTKNYVENLQQITNKYKLNKKLTLIDMTGGTPLANVIIGADFLGTPWLLGAYPGSNAFVARILQPYIHTEKLKGAWILVSPEGRRKLDIDILNNLNLNFPNRYINIGTFKTGYREEIQELWKPKFE